MRKFRLFLICGLVCLLFASCNTYKRSMREPNVRVELNSNDFTFSKQVTGEATVTKILGVDWARLFGTMEMGEIESPLKAQIPIIGDLIIPEASYAIYNMMQKNPGYDVVIYPQVESHKRAPILGTDIYSTTTYKVTARLGKLK